MLPDSNRRMVLVGVGGVLTGAVGATGFDNLRSLGRTPRLERESFVRTEASVVAGTEPLDEQGFPYYYAKLVDSEDAAASVNWNVVREEMDAVADSFEGVDYSTHLLTVVGFVLPNRLMLESRGTTFSGQVIEDRYEVLESNSGAPDREQIHNVLTLWEQNGSDPSELSVSISFPERP